MTRYHLAQLNIATMREPLESPSMAEFVANLDRINALADAAPGFVWRLKDEQGDATSARPFGDNILVNLSVWESIESLHHFAFRTAHTDIMRRKREWFDRMKQAYAVLWWIAAGHIPSTTEAARRLMLLRDHGPTAEAFIFRQPFAPAGEGPETAARNLDDACPLA
ncbi:MAG: DUF3291 domain-containing protein [Gammaproteobacteria bacterium]|nr:DUF3291 domain-containing protein [Gammaproteobacteria bacterium]